MFIGIVNKDILISPPLICTPLDTLQIWPNFGAGKILKRQSFWLFLPKNCNYLKIFLRKKITPENTHPKVKNSKPDKMNILLGQPVHTWINPTCSRPSAENMLLVFTVWSEGPLLVQFLYHRDIGCTESQQPKVCLKNWSMFYDAGVKNQKFKNGNMTPIPSAYKK